MEPGRVMDTLVAAKVFGWREIDPQGPWGRPPSGVYQVVPKYSTHIEAAWEIAELLQYDYLVWIQANGEGWGVEVLGPLTGDGQKSLGEVEEGEAESAAHALCLAGLQVVEKEERKE